MRKQPLPRNQLRQAILRCVVVSSASLVISVNPLIANATDIVFADEPETCDFIYGVNDDKLNNSQFFKIDPSDYAITPIGMPHEGLDLEALDVSASGEIYVAAGDDTDDVSKAGYLYKFDPNTEELTEVCPTGFAEVDGLSFNPNPEIGGLYGWAQDAGLIKITIPDQFPSEVPCATLIHESRGEFEDLTWGNDGFTLYVVKNDHGNYTHEYIYTNDKATYIPDPENDSDVPHELIAYTVVGDTIIETQICPGVIASLGEIESLEIDTTDMLLLGYHVSKNKPMMATLDPITCQINPLLTPRYPSEIIPGQDSDIEAIGVCPCIDPPEMDWQYAADHPKDAIGLKALEIFGTAIKLKGNRVIVAINANMPATGVDVPEAMTGPKTVVDGNVAFSDFNFKFANGSMYSVHFSMGNDSSVTEPGVYKNPELFDVTKENFGTVHLLQYLSILGDVEATMGEEGLPSELFVMNTPRGLDMSIATGDKVIDDYRELTEADLIAEGLDFKTGLGMDKIGKYTFGFDFTRQMDMTGAFLGWFVTECSNDGIAIIGELPECEHPELTAPVVVNN